MDSILDPPGLPLGSLLAPKMAETCVGIPLGAAKSRSRLLFSAPSATQEASKSAPISPWKTHLGRPSLFKSSKRPPRGLQEASRAHLAAMLVPFWSHFGAISKRCCHHVGHVSLLKAPSPRAFSPTPQARRNARERLNLSKWWDRKAQF